MRSLLVSRLVALAAKIDLGESAPFASLAGCGSQSSPRTWYPSLYVSGQPKKLALPDSGKAIVEYKVVSRSTNESDGEERHSATIEVRSIEPLDDDGKKDGGRARPLKASALHAIRPGIIRLDSRARNSMGEYAPEGTGISPAEMTAAYGPVHARGSALGIGLVGAAAGLGGAAAALRSPSAQKLAQRLRNRR